MDAVHPIFGGLGCRSVYIANTETYRCYRPDPCDHWFWVDDSAWTAKRALTAVMFFFTLTETDTGQRVPLVTIPAR